jgi:wyosine [tRNA(Phe)-imidazoG37] synthetase (radical SAM superfamily)
VLGCGRLLVRAEELKYVFGPVASRRLGRSLGVDPIPFKTCHWNCVYCQLGRTAPLRTERRLYVEVEEVVAEVRSAIRAHPGGIDWITFGGSGEPTLHSGLGRMIRAIKATTALPIAVLTSGALLDCAEVRSDLMLADVVLPSLDAGSEEVYRRVNRPWPELTHARLVEGLLAFRRVFEGRMWVEVMLVRGLNDSDESLEEIAAVLKRLRPHQVHLVVPSRLPAEPWVGPPDEDRLSRAVAIFAKAAPVLRPSRAGDETACPQEPPRALGEIVQRHPLSEEELREALVRWMPNGVEAGLADVQARPHVKVVSRGGRRYWTHADGRYSE